MSVSSSGWKSSCAAWRRWVDSPADVVLLHHAIALGELGATGQPPRECPERLAIAAADEQAVLAPFPHGLRGEGQAIDGGEVGREVARRRLVGHAVNPDRPLTAPPW